MSNIPLTPNGISKSTGLTGRIHDTDIVLQVLDLSEVVSISYIRTKRKVVVSDGVHHAQGIAVVPVEHDDLLHTLNKWTVIRVRNVMACHPLSTSPHLILENPEILKHAGKILGTPFAIPTTLPSTPGGNHVPITALMHFRENEFPPLRVLVTYKSRLSDPRRPSFSPFFVLHLLDESSEIRADAKDLIAVELYDRFVPGKTYIISSFGYRDFDKINNDFWFNLRNKHSLCLTKTTVVEECSDTHDLPKLRFNFISIPKLCRAHLPHYQFATHGFGRPLRKAVMFANGVDVIGVVKSVGLLEEFMAKRTPKRDVVIFDQAGILFPVTLWSYNAEEFSAVPGDVVAFRNARLTETREFVEGETPVISRVLTVVTPSTVHVEPDVEERVALDHLRQLNLDFISIQNDYESKHMVLGAQCED